MTSHRLAAALAMAGILAGCSPYASTIGGWDAPSLEKRENQATAACQQSTGQVPPNPFTTDGCTLFPDGAWQSCCVDHDAAYWCGGNAEARRQADLQLRACVKDKGGPAGLMYDAVRVGGHPYTPAPWRWGYGWPYGHGYTEEKSK